MLKSIIGEIWSIIDSGLVLMAFNKLVIIGLLSISCTLLLFCMSYCNAALIILLVKMSGIYIKVNVVHLA